MSEVNERGLTQLLEEAAQLVQRSIISTNGNSAEVREMAGRVLDNEGEELTLDDRNELRYSIQRYDEAVANSRGGRLNEHDSIMCTARINTALLDIIGRRLMEHEAR